MPDEVGPEHLVPHEVGPRTWAADAAKSGRPELAQAWALIAIGDELKMIRQEMHRQARAGGRRG